MPPPPLFLSGACKVTLPADFAIPVPKVTHCPSFSLIPLRLRRVVNTGPKVDSSPPSQHRPMNQLTGLPRHQLNPQVVTFFTDIFLCGFPFCLLFVPLCFPAYECVFPFFLSVFPSFLPSFLTSPPGKRMRRYMHTHTHTYTYVNISVHVQFGPRGMGSCVIATI